MRVQRPARASTRRVLRGSRALRVGKVGGWERVEVPKCFKVLIKGGKEQTVGAGAEPVTAARGKADTGLNIKHRPPPRP